MESFKTLKFKEIATLVGKDDYGGDSGIFMSGQNYYENLHDISLMRYKILKYFNSNVKFKYFNININRGEIIIKYPTLDSGIDDYIYELIIRGLPELYKREKKHSVDLYNEYMILEFINDTKQSTIDEMLNENIVGGNRMYYYNFIRDNLEIYDPEMFFIDNDNFDHVFNFLRVNNYVHGILTFIKESDNGYYETIADKEAFYHDKSNIKNKNLSLLIDNFYGGNDWKCFTKNFVKTKLDLIVNLSIKNWEISEGFYNLNSLLTYHFKDVLEFDYNKYMIGIKKDVDEESVTIVRPVGSDSHESHGELYDLLRSKDSGRRFPDIIGSMKHINVHCEEINGLESVFIDHDGNQKHNKMIGTIKINPSGGEFFGTRNEYDNERKRITLNGPVLLNLVIQ